jgi:hypothetical protein
MQLYFYHALGYHLDNPELIGKKFHENKVGLNPIDNCNNNNTLYKPLPLRFYIFLLPDLVCGLSHCKACYCLTEGL